MYEWPPPPPTRVDWLHSTPQVSSTSSPPLSPQMFSCPIIYMFNLKSFCTCLFFSLFSASPSAPETLMVVVGDPGRESRVMWHHCTLLTRRLPLPTLTKFCCSLPLSNESIRRRKKESLYIVSRVKQEKIKDHVYASRLRHIMIFHGSYHFKT